MSLLISGLKAFRIQWPLRFPIEHGLAANAATDNLVVELIDSQGRVGWGEGVPRGYVTGEAWPDTLRLLQDHLAPTLLGADLEPREALGFLSRNLDQGLIDRAPAAACAVETALLDLAGQDLGLPVVELLGGLRRRELTYSAVIPFCSPELLEVFLQQVAAMAINQVKIKVGRDDDLERIQTAIRILGPGVRLRVDANGAWDRALAGQRLEALADLGVESVEQPLVADDLEGLAALNAASPLLIWADESLCTLEQARRLIARRAVGGFNLRLSKCGGPARTLEMLSLAREAGLAVMMGCQVGELGVLSAMGRHLAAAVDDLVHLEGCLTRFYVQGDIVEKDLSFGPRGAAEPLAGPGLGITARWEVRSREAVLDLA